MKNQCAQAFRTIRLTNKLTQDQFSEKLNISSSFVGQIEQGKSYPSYEVLYKVIEIFEVDANLFFGGGSAQSVINNAFYTMVSNLSAEQLDGIKDLLKFVNNVSMLNNDDRDSKNRQTSEPKNT